MAEQIEGIYLLVSSLVGPAGISLSHRSVSTVVGQKVSIDTLMPSDAVIPVPRRLPASYTS